jgi:hypothetical protein
MDVARLPVAVPTRLGVARGWAYTVSAPVEYWMDAAALARNNLTYAVRISYRQTER